MKKADDEMNEKKGEKSSKTFALLEIFLLNLSLHLKCQIDAYLTSNILTSNRLKLSDAKERFNVNKSCRLKKLLRKRKI